ncbi:MAG: hypothetical protein GY859_31000, partial [Desulfobacterales bacterium]|nr:hypothetical protein [Desulfobacterales bacterium]
MKEKLLKLYEGLKERGLTPERDQMMKAEIRSAGSHEPLDASDPGGASPDDVSPPRFRGFYASDDPT